MLLVQAQAYRQQYGFNAIYLLPVNLYGPGDNFDPKSSHVIPALIRKIWEAKVAGNDFVSVWGDGTASREFLFVDDAANAIVRASELYDGAAPINIGSGDEITIRELVDILCSLLKFEGRIQWDTSKPNGQPRRGLEVSRARESFGFEARTDFFSGVQKTCEWWTQVMSTEIERQGGALVPAFAR
jgi:GDP-L-fucose synthase